MSHSPDAPRSSRKGWGLGAFGVWRLFVPLGGGVHGIAYRRSDGVYVLPLTSLKAKRIDTVFDALDRGWRIVRRGLVDLNELSLL